LYLESCMEGPLLIPPKGKVKNVKKLQNVDLKRRPSSPPSEGLGEAFSFAA
jgi:hypothetical protein